MSINNKHRNYYTAGAILLLLVACLLALEFTNTTHLLHKQKAVSGTIPAKTTKSSPQSSTTPTKTDKSSPSVAPVAPSKGDSIGAQSGGGSSSGLATGDGPLAPYGTLVSNHRPNLGGSPAPSAEQSFCNTSPGAMCYMEFTQGDVIKKLASQKADDSGVAAWSWDVKTAGFTEGNWKITAVATLNGQTKSTTDTLDLVVQ